MGEAVLGAFLQVLLEKLADQEITEYFGRLMVDKKVLEKWTSTLKAIEAVLSDAEEKQLTQGAVKEWLDDLRDLAYDVQDVLDIFDTKMLKRRIERQQGSKSNIWSLLSKVKSNFGLNSAIKKLSDRLERITTRQKHFGLKELGVSKKPWIMPPSTTSQLLDGPVIGRDEAKTKILNDVLLEGEHSTSNFHNFRVVSIVGTGGLGKTTLAKDVFNDAAPEQFRPKGWVSVSDDFDLLRVTTAVLESVTSGSVKESKELNSVLVKLSEELAGKKFLIVLDDVWNTCNYDQWTKLQSAFRVGAVGSIIIVTTRDANVAKMMGDNKPHNLELMSGDDCWKIFEHHALLNNNPQDVELFKEKIVEKCNGLPLAAKTLGGLLRCKEKDEWEKVLEHKMWKISDQMGILPALKLSYHYLPSTLKRCFSYCAILPNDYEFEEMQLVFYWMAEGLIQQQPEENKQKEDLGRDNFQELVSRSLFQKSSKTESKYIMHDLVTDLARWAAGSSCSRLEDMQNRCLPKVRHSSYIPGTFDGVKKFEVYSKATCLRTFLPLSLPCWNNNYYLAQKVTFDLLPKLQYLRLLSLNGYQIPKLPDTIGQLKHLRYLDLSHTLIRSLPDSTTTLYNLQTLLLKSCHELKALPTSMRNLVNLRHLNNSETSSLEEMPPQLGQLTNLQTLPKFVIGKGSGSGVREIESLLHLQGTLHISRLENVICVEDARSANCLKSKERLEALFLEWSSSSVSTEDAAIVLDMLQPHSKLKKLTITGYGGSKFSTWIGNPSFTKMVRVKLEGCNHCRFLPPFGQLPCLKELCIQNMNAVKSVGIEFYGEGNLPFQALETLLLHSLKNWKKWSHCQQSEGIKVFSCLKKLSIWGCPKLEGDLPEKLDSLANLEIDGCEELVVSVCKYKQLHGSNIKNCKMVVYDTSTVQFDLLQSLTFSNLSELRFQTEAFMKSLKNIKELKITGCEELTFCFQNEDRLLQHLISLGRLYIEDNSILVEKLGIEAEQLVQLQILDCKIKRLELSKCGSLVKVPEGLHHLTSLQELHISLCSSLISFPDVGLPSCLQVIEIWYCESLLHFAKYQIPPSLKRIEIRNCGNLKSLIEKEEEVGNGSSSSCLESLRISNCPSLMRLLCKGQLPRSLKQLQIMYCGQLELISERFIDDSCQLELIDICHCPNLKSLPEGLESLIVRDCQSLVSLPRMNVWPREIRIANCDKLEVAQLARDMMHTSNLEQLSIPYFEGLTTTTSFPTNLTSLSIYKIKNCKALMESQGLQRLTSLRELRLRGEDDGGLVSFPPAAENSKETEILLPRSLVDLSIGGFPNLKKLSKGFQFLTSLESIEISNCPKLTTLPVEEGLPLSLGVLSIYNCPLLEQRYKGRYRHKIAHIPCVRINVESRKLLQKLPDLPVIRHNQPVVMYSVSPKVIHASVNEFMSLVQRLTGLTSSTDTMIQASSTRATELFRCSPGILCPAPDAMPPIQAGYFPRDFNIMETPSSNPALFPPPLFSQLPPQQDEECESLPEQLEWLLSLYFSLFPSEYEFRKDELIRMWIAEGFVENGEGKRMEDIGSVYFNSLYKAGFLVLSRYDSKVAFDSVYSVPIYNPGNLLYKVNLIKLLELGNTAAPVKCFKTVNGKLDGDWEMTQYLSWNCKGVDEMNFQVLKNFRHLRTLILSGCGSSIKHVPHDLFLILKDLRTLNLSQTLVSELPNSIRHVKSLRYLDLSSTHITRLPDSIDSLHYLQTIKLRGCVHFHQLPKGMKKLISLRHIDLDIIRQLPSMPPYLGNLTSLQTLSAFVVGREDGCRIGELKNLNDLRGVLRISRLENVSNKEEAEEAALIDKKCLQRLELRWSNVFTEKKEEQEKILECLQPHSGLKELQIHHYAGSALPTWISNPSFSELVVLTLFRCRNCELLPSIGKLPMLRSLSIIEMNEVKEINHQFLGVYRAFHPFPKLEILEIDTMLNLKEWKQVNLGDFPSLLKITVDTCPQLYSLPPLLSFIKTLKHLEIRRCPKLLSLPRKGLPTSLESFILIDCPELKERCRMAEDWRKIYHVPNIWFDCEEVRPESHSGTGTSAEISEENMELDTSSLCSSPI